MSFKKHEGYCRLANNKHVSCNQCVWQVMAIQGNFLMHIKTNNVVVLWTHLQDPTKSASTKERCIFCAHYETLEQIAGSHCNVILSALV